MTITTGLVRRLIVRSYPQCTIKQWSPAVQVGWGVSSQAFQTIWTEANKQGSMWSSTAIVPTKWRTPEAKQVELLRWERPQKLGRCSDEMSGNGYVYCYVGFSALKKNYVSPSNCFHFSSQWVWHPGTFGPRSSFECHPWYKRSVVSAELFNREVSITAVVIKARQQIPTQSVR